jgi:hypothetical protein
MKKYLYLISFTILTIIISCVSNCEEEDYINSNTRYTVHYINEGNINEYNEYNEYMKKHSILEEIEPKYIVKKLNQLRKGEKQECYFEKVDEDLTIIAKDHEVIAKLFFKEYNDGTFSYKKYTLGHIKENRNYNVEAKGMKLHSMYNGDYVAEIVGNIIFKTTHENMQAYVEIPFHVKVYFNLTEKTTKFILHV